jgi:ABC-type phosphate/phosphonate transport system substrate-binding protein
VIASLPMHDRPENAAAHDALWACIRDALRARGVAAPEALDRGIGLWEGWQHPALVLGQTCGLPYRTRLHGRVSLIATFDYGLEDTPPGYYRSLFVARADDPRRAPEDFADARFAFNEGGSHSGWAAPQLWAAARGFAFAPSLATGAHRLSARAVAAGQADIAAIDAITWRGIARWESEVAGALKVVGRTDAAPGLPLIAAAGTDADRHAEAVAEALDRLAPAARATLGITGVLRIPAAAYLAVPTPPDPAGTAA